jgi:glycosyltransferase involved in cell wall biosynthesis
MRKVLIITYYWPPSGGSAVLRWLKFTKYLRGYGWDPVIYTPSNPEPQEIDHSLLQDIPPGLEIITSPIREPYRVYKQLTGRKKEDRLGVALMTDKKAGVVSRMALWIRSNLFIPDPRRGWVRPSIRKLTAYLRQHAVDVVITTGPPHSMHLIGMGLKAGLGIKWVADFRDPWTNIDFYRDLSLTRMADLCHRKLERKVLEQADHVITVSPGMTRDFIAMGIRNVTTITNGFDEVPVSPAVEVATKFVLLHLGSMPKSRNPENLWQVLSKIAMEDDGFASQLEIRLIGKVDLAVTGSIMHWGLKPYVVFADYIAHEQTFAMLQNASVLLLCINNTPNAGGILTNKFFEYLSASRPILALGPVDGDASAVLQETRAGRMFEYSDIKGLESHVRQLYVLFRQQRLITDNQDISKFSRRNLTHDLTQLLNRIIT